MKCRRLEHLVALSLLSGIALLLLWVTGPIRAQEPGWSEPVSLSENFPQSLLPDIAADQAGNLYVVWDALFEERDGGWGDGIWCGIQPSSRCLIHQADELDGR